MESLLKESDTMLDMLDATLPKLKTELDLRGGTPGDSLKMIQRLSPEVAKIVEFFDKSYEQYRLLAGTTLRDDRPTQEKLPDSR